MLSQATIAQTVAPGLLALAEASNLDGRVPQLPIDVENIKNKRKTNRSQNSSSKNVRIKIEND